MSSLRETALTRKMHVSADNRRKDNQNGDRWLTVVGVGLDGIGVAAEGEEGEEGDSMVFCGLSAFWRGWSSIRRLLVGWSEDEKVALEMVECRYFHGEMGEGKVRREAAMAVGESEKRE
ncbi:hypothetical protein HAX54_029069 [Datura stramonium]|uniref:Uncharacterized protein n=1 Tax=Datura stramonium TaxID=4076 RepID=A0ABS8V820_DATST|nr:hypothetical protein [Datura stramonium]